MFEKKQLPIFFGGVGFSKFWDPRCLSAHISNHVSKFHGDGDRPKELGDIAQSAKNKKKKEKA